MSEHWGKPKKDVLHHKLGTWNIGTSANASGSNIRSFKWMMNRPKAFEILKFESKCDCNLSLSKSSDSYCNFSLNRIKITCT